MTHITLDRAVVQRALECIQCDREALYHGHFDPKTGKPDVEGQAGIDEYDAISAELRAALEQPQTTPKIAGYIARTGHGNYFHESITDDQASLLHGDKPMWEAVYTGGVPDHTALLHEARNAMDEATTNTSSTTRSPSMTRDLENAIAALRTRLAQPEGEPYAYIYETNSPFGLHQSLSPTPYNGRSPDRTVPVYRAPQPAVPEHKPLTESDLASACLSYRHDFGLMEPQERKELMQQARWWAVAFGITGEDK